MHDPLMAIFDGDEKRRRVPGCNSRCHARPFDLLQPNTPRPRNAPKPFVAQTWKGRLGDGGGLDSFDWIQGQQSRKADGSG